MSDIFLPFTTPNWRSAPLWQALKITLICSLILAIKIQLQYETPIGRAFFEDHYYRMQINSAVHWGLIWTPVLIHLFHARQTKGRFLNIAFAVAGIYTWQFYYFPLGLGLLSLLGVIPDWLGVAHNFVFERPIWFMPL